MAKSLDPRVIEGLDAEAREAVNAVFDALSDWREEVGGSIQRCNESVLERMATAAEALGWPKELVEFSRKHLTESSKIQLGMIDQLMDAWQAQVRSPMPDQFVAQLRALQLPSVEAPGMAMLTAPMEMWWQAAEMWQRNWASTLSAWAADVRGSDKGVRGKQSATRTH
jgi:hypothetical protein